jgi:hypothetical protein
MATIRALSLAAELAGFVLILTSIRIERALRVNSALGLVGPLVFITVSAVGLAGLAGRVGFGRLALVAAGVLLVFLGTFSRG